MSAKFLVSRVKNIDMVGFLWASQSQLRIQKLIRLLLYFEVGDHLNFAIPQGDQKNFTHAVGGESQKIYRT